MTTLIVLDGQPVGMSPPSARRDLRVLRNKREATRYGILVEIADRQPAVSQREIAESIGVTAQAVSEHVSALVDEGFVEKRGRGRYRVTKEGIDWLLSRTEELRGLADYVTDELVGGVEVEAAIAEADVESGDPVTLSMRKGVLHATPGRNGRATAVADRAAEAGGVVPVSDFDGLLDYEPARVTILSIPSVTDSAEPVDRAAIEPHLDTDLVAVAGTEALAAVRAAGREADLRFGTAAAVPEAAARGLSVTLVAVESSVSTHADRLREEHLSFDVIDLGTE